MLNEEALEVIWTRQSMRKRNATNYIRELQPENEFGPRTGQVVMTQTSHHVDPMSDSEHVSNFLSDLIG